MVMLAGPLWQRLPSMALVLAGSFSRVSLVTRAINRLWPLLTCQGERIRVAVATGRSWVHVRWQWLLLFGVLLWWWVDVVVVVATWHLHLAGSFCSPARTALVALCGSGCLCVLLWLCLRRGPHPVLVRPAVLWRYSARSNSKCVHLHLVALLKPVEQLHSNPCLEIC